MKPSAAEAKDTTKGGLLQHAVDAAVAVISTQHSLRAYHADTGVSETNSDTAAKVYSLPLQGKIPLQLMKGHVHMAAAGQSRQIAATL